MISRLRESLALALLALLPFHALLVTVLTKLFLGVGHAPMPVLALWKEGVLGVILLLACIEIVLRAREKKVVVSACLPARQVQWSVDALDITILLGIFYAFVLEFFTSHYSLTTTHSSFLLGFKYDFIPLVAFLILRRVPWSPWFGETVVRVLLEVGTMISVYGILTFFLPLTFFTWLGYSDLHSLYQADGPLAAFQQIGGSSLRRIQSTMSGPNQLGMWLLIPLGLGISMFFGRQKVASSQWLVISFVVALLLTFSRAAWLGAAVMFATALWLSPDMAKRTKVWWLAGVGSCIVTCGIILTLLYPSLLLRVQSSSDHLKKPVEAMKLIIAHPFGLGLGFAGPASNRSSDTCVMQDAGTDFSWAADRQNLCIFVGGVQVQPVTRACSCPLLTENWYLQWGVEMGWFGLVLSVMLMFLIFRQWLVVSGQWPEKLLIHLVTNHYPLLSFFGISIAALFLHAWEDAAVAYSVWVLMSTALPCRDRPQDQTVHS